MDKTETSMMEIAQSKIFADEAKYFSLFEKHIPDLGSDKKVLIYAIDNLGCICRMIEKNPDAKYTIYGNACVNDCVKNFYPEAETIDSNPGNLKEYNIDMKFDCIIGNPPYDKSLHLKILRETMKHVDLESDGVIIWLSPVRWLQDPIALDKKVSDFKRYQDSICMKLASVDVVKASDANELFNIANFTDLAIYCLNKNGGYNHDKIINDYLGPKRSIFNKVYPFCREHNFSDKLVYNLKGISVKFNDLLGFGSGHNFSLVSKCHSHPYIDGKTEDGQTYADCAFKKKDVNENKQEQSTVKFSTIEEAKNFIKTVQTNFMMFINSCTKRDVHVALMALPWMGDCINPRNGKKGYESEWTDEDFYQFFDITDEEKKIIEDTMAKHTK